MPDNTKRHEFARQAFSLAIEGLNFQLSTALAAKDIPAEWDMRALAHVGAAMAIKEAWEGKHNRASDACVKWHNWTGISPVDGQAAHNNIRVYVSDEAHWANWAWHVLFSRHYQPARERLDKALHFWDVCEGNKAGLLGVANAYKAFALVLAKTWCESDLRYGLDLVNIMGEIAPVVKAAPTVSELNL